MIVTKKNGLLGFSSSSKTVKRVAMEVINVLQDYPAGDQVIGLSVLWLMLCERYDVDPNDMLAKACRLRNDTFDSKFNHQFLALKEYFKNELR